MADEVRITNEGGKLVGKDGSGNTVALVFGDLEPDSVDTSSVSTDSATVSSAPSNSDDVARLAEVDALDLEDVRSVDNQIAGPIDANGQNITGIADLGFETPQDSLQTVADAGSTQTVDASTASIWDVTLTTGCTISLGGAAASVGNSVTLYLRQDGAGGHSVTWDSAIEWADGSAPSLTTSANTLSVLTFTSVDGGTSWQGYLGGDAFA